MFEQILEIVSEKSTRKIITTKDTYSIIKTFFNEEDNLEIFYDARSAAFFSLGNSSLDENETILIIRGEYLSNIYTAMTEAWFQKKQIIVIAVYEKYDDIKCEYIRRCMPNIINIYDQSIEMYKEKIQLVLNQNYPCLINIVMDISNISKKKINYENIFKKFSNLLCRDDEIFVYNSIDRKYDYQFKIKNIEEKNKYGALSKYIGYVTAKEKKIVLCAPLEILTIDLNIFNNRYTDSNVKIILFGKESKEVEISNWVRENKINIKFLEEIDDKELKEFYNSDKPEIIFIGGIE